MNIMLRKLWLGFKWTGLIFFVTSISWVIILKWINPPMTYLMWKRTVQQAVNGKPIRFQHDWVSFEHISPNLTRAVIASEDNRFVEHFGIDFESIQKAMRFNQRSKRTKGGSTISQQTAKNIFLWPNRTYVRKGLELYFTVLIEAFWSKERIMEVYLNMIEMGDGVYGAEKAARIHFNKPASQLTRAESALIASSLPSPRKRNPSKPSGYMLRRQAQILNVMNKLGPIEF